MRTMSLSDSITLTLLHLSYLQERQLDWFPRMRAMSLANDDGDSEQNDIRILQVHLESTNRIVKDLSKQLSELKDQVSSRQGS